MVRRGVPARFVSPCEYQLRNMASPVLVLPSEYPRVSMVQRTAVQAPPQPPSRSPEPPRRRRSFKWIWLIVLAALGYGGFRYYQATQVKQRAADAARNARIANRSVPVAAARARTGDIPIY